MQQTTQNSKVIKATREKLYQAFTNPSSLEVWMAPDNMVAKVHNFDLRVGGSYIMSLFYKDSEKDAKGKTSEKEDKYTATFIKLTAPDKIVQAIQFDSSDPAFSGEMIMDVSFEEENEGTRVTFLFTHIPVGIKPEDNEAGTISTLNKLAKFVQ